MLHGFSWQNALVLTIFVLICGFIAYWGDLLGRKMGKRRLTLFGLRPRYTAIAATTVTGMIIAVLTIATMASVSQRVRLLLLQGSEIVAQQRRLEQQLSSTREDFRKTSSELEVQKVAADSARKEADSARSSLRKLIDQRDRLTRVLETLRADLRKQQTALRAAEKNLSTATTNLASARREVSARRAEIKTQQARISLLEQRRNRLATEVAGLAANLGEAAENWPKYIGLRQGNIIFRYGQEVARSIVPGSRGEQEIRDAVLALYASADVKAKQLGAKVGNNGRAIRIRPTEVEKGKFLPESRTMDAVVENIRASSEPVVLRVISLGNSVEGEQMLVDFVLNPHNVIYRAGDEIASANIDGTQSESEIFGGLQGFFRNNVRASAISDGVIPSTDEDGQPSVGLYPGDEFLSLMNRIVAARRPVRITARAVTDIRSGDNLVLDINLSDAQ